VAQRQKKKLCCDARIVSLVFLAHNTNRSRKSFWGKIEMEGRGRLSNPRVRIFWLVVRGEFIQTCQTKLIPKFRKLPCCVSKVMASLNRSAFLRYTNESCRRSLVGQCGNSKKSAAPYQTFDFEILHRLRESYGANG
jgi:hypothetical protein